MGFWRVSNSVGAALACALAITLTTPATAQNRGLAIFDTTNQACVFDIATDTILSCFPYVGGSDGDCVITGDGSLGVFTSSTTVLLNRVHTVDMNTMTQISTSAVTPSPLDVSLVPGCSFAAMCNGGTTNSPAVTIDLSVSPPVEVDTTNMLGMCNSIDVCNDGTALLTRINGQVGSASISPTGFFTDLGFRGTFGTSSNSAVCAPNSQCGVSIARTGATNIYSFTVPNLVATNSVTTGTFGLSAVFNQAGTVLFVRDQTGVNAWNYDPLNCLIGTQIWDQVATTMPTYYGMDGLSLSPDGTKLYVTAGAVVNVRDPATGAIVTSMSPPTTLAGATGVCVPDIHRTGCGTVVSTGGVTLACGPLKQCTDPGQCTAAVTCNDGVAVCRDSQGLPVTVTCDPPGPYANGAAVTVTCTNGTDTETQVCNLDIIDVESPTCGAPMPTTVECSAPCGAPATDPAVAAWLAAGTAGDNCPGATIANNPDACYAANCAGAEHVVKWIATDAGGYERSCSSNLTVVDTVGPSVVDCDLPAAPAPPGPATSGASSGPASGDLWLVDCGTAADACSGANVGATFVVTNTDENCLPVVEVVHVNCGDLVGIEILEAPNCPGSPPAAAAASSYFGAGCELVLSGESVELVVGATDACGNVGMCSTVFVPPPFTEEPAEVTLEALPGSTSTASTSTRSVPLWSQGSVR